MNKGQCLCGTVKWELSAEPERIYNCHCRMCQKAHGTAFGTYFFMTPGTLKITEGQETIVTYRSSEFLTRHSCDTCGSVVPYPGGTGVEELAVVPGGCHDHGRQADCNIFVPDAPPWFEVTGPLPRHDAYPEGTGIPDVPDTPLPPKPDGVVRGSCLCGAVAFHVTEPMKAAFNCHCSRCRRARAAAHASNGFTSAAGVTFLKGEDNLKRYKLPGAKVFEQVFCRTCSSPMPRINHQVGNANIPLGVLDDDPGIRPMAHIYTDDMAGWHEITDDTPRHPEGPER
ncbi:MAG: GFA family protein [Pseudomonadota bacterium]